MTVRPIDGEALWDKLEDALWYDNYDRDMAEKIVLDMPTLIPSNEWVSVEDRLLERGGGNVLVYAIAKYIDGTLTARLSPHADYTTRRIRWALRS